MKTIFLVIVFKLACILNAQSQVTNNDVLEVFLNDSAFGKFVVPGFYKHCDTIYIVDTLNQFSDKHPVKFYKSVVIERTYNKKPPLTKWYCYNLITTLKFVRNKIYILNYFHEPSNSAGFVKYKLRSDKLIMIKHQYGQY